VIPENRGQPRGNLASSRSQVLASLLSARVSPRAYLAREKYFSAITFRISLLASILTLRFLELCAFSRGGDRAISEPAFARCERILPGVPGKTTHASANSVRGTKIRILKRMKVNGDLPSQRMREEAPRCTARFLLQHQY
jgi:hypothetical protein